jgi:hemerythrin
MALILWSDGMSVGIQVFDNEHKQLVNLVNKLYDALMAGSAKKTMEDILKSLVNYTKIHFKHEEDYMTLHDYPEYVSHKKEHDELTAQVMDFYERYEAGKTSFSIELMTFLKDWLVKHILGSDKKYREFFIAKGVS